MNHPEIRSSLAYGVGQGMVWIPSLALSVDGGQPPVDLFAKALEVAGYLLIFIVLAALVVHLGKRFQTQLGNRGLIQIEDGHSFAPGVGIRLVRVGSRAWLLGITRERISLLAEISEKELHTTGEPHP